MAIPARKPPSVVVLVVLAARAEPPAAEKESLARVMLERAAATFGESLGRLAFAVLLVAALLLAARLL